MYILTEYHMSSDNMSAENVTIYSTISIKYKQLYHILDYGQHLKPGLHSVRRSTQTEMRKRIYADMRVMAYTQRLRAI